MIFNPGIVPPSGGGVTIGSYVGNGADTQDVQLEKAPALMIIWHTANPAQSVGVIAFLTIFTGVWMQMSTSSVKTLSIANYSFEGNILHIKNNNVPNQSQLNIAGRTYYYALLG